MAVIENSYDYAAFGQRIRAVRKRLGINGKDFAARLGIQNSYLSEIEHGKGNPTVAFFDRLHHVFQINLHYVISGKGEMLETDDGPLINPADQPPGYIANAEDLYWYIKHCMPMKDAVMGFAAKYFLENEKMVSAMLDSKSKGSLSPSGLFSTLHKT